MSLDGATVDLRPVRYEFPDVVGAGADDWDANWLVVRGQVRVEDGRSWSFSDPCLTTWEARSLGDWLRAVVAGEVEPTEVAGDAEAMLETFMEPNLAVSLAGRSDASAVVRFHFSFESRPAWVSPDVEVHDFWLALDVPLPELSAAVDDWESELSPFPAR